MIELKSENEILSMKTGGAILHNALGKVKDSIKIGHTVESIDSVIEEYILSQGGEPGFKKVKGYKWATCISINDEIVHAPPVGKVIKDGDVITVDSGVYYHGLHTDSAITVQVGRQDKKVTNFLKVGQKALEKAIGQAKIGNRIGHISQVFQSEIEGNGYSIIYELTGHGVGKELHEDPFIPCYLDKSIDRTMKIQEGMTLALEVMYTMGKGKIKYANDGWTIMTADRSIAACFEHSVAIKRNSTLILT